MEDDLPARVLLDTHIWIWLMNGDGHRLRPRALAAIEGAAEHGAVHVAAISTWEVAMLEGRGRLRLSGDSLAWVRSALSAPGITQVPLSPEIAVASTRLPGNLHGDPADRILVATARMLDVTLVTQDELIQQYGAAGYVSVMRA